MKTLITAPNILTTIDIPLTGLNIKNQRWEIKYNVSQTNLIEGKTTPIVSNRIITILPEEMVEWMASWDGEATLTDQSYQRVLAHEGIVEWSDDVITDIENNPDADVIQPWVVGELVAPPNRRSYQGKVYAVVQAHTTLANWTPDIVPALFTYLFDEDNEGEGLQPWVQPVGSSDAYPTGAQVTHNGKCWENTESDANVWEPGVFGWTEIPCL